MRRSPNIGFSAFNLHPAGQLPNDPVLAVHRHAVHQPGPQALVELGDGLGQILHALNEAQHLLKLDAERCPI